MDPNDSAVDLGWIFEGPIEAVIRANIMAARQFVEFLKAEGFMPSTGDPGQTWGELRMVTFSFEVPGDTSGLPVKRFFRVPFLSMIPLPLLEVKTATFDFGIRVLGIVEDHIPTSINLMGTREDMSPPSRGRWHGMLANNGPRQGSETTPDLAPHLSANLDAKVTVGQADIPAGIRNMLAVMGENAQMTTTILLLEPNVVRISRSKPRVAVTLTLRSQTRRSSGDLPVFVTYKEQGLYIVLDGPDGPDLWRSGTSRNTDRFGRIKFEVIWYEIEPLETTDTSFTFSTDVDAVDSRSDLYCRFLPEHAVERIA